MEVACPVPACTTEPSLAEYSSQFVSAKMWCSSGVSSGMVCGGGGIGVCAGHCHSVSAWQRLCMWW